METNAKIDGDGNILIQNIDGSNITINPDNTEELRKLIINLGDQISVLPQNVLEMINNKQNIENPIVIGANIYLTLLVKASMRNYDAHEFLFGVTITNLTKEIRYFNQPFFKVFPAFKLKDGITHDTFIMAGETTNPSFPHRLEYGQPVSVSYPVNPNVIENYKQILAEDKDAYIKCLVTTTVGELYESNEFKISKLLKYIKE